MLVLDDAVMTSNTLRGNIDVQKFITYSGNINNPTKIYKIGDLVTVQFNITGYFARDIRGNTTQKANFFIKISKLESRTNITYNIEFQSNLLNIVKWFNGPEDSWRLLTDDLQKVTTDVAIRVEVVETANELSSLYTDSELTDLELRGQDGSVHVHRTVLAAYSPVMKTMLCGEWKETTEGRVEVPSITKKTLEDFKKYIYLKQLPDAGLEELLLLSKYYMMPKLEWICTEKLVNELKAENTYELLKFAFHHEITELTLAILKCVQNNVVDEQEIRKHVLHEDVVHKCEE